MFYAIHPLPKSRAQMRVGYDHIAYFFCLAAGWATLTAQAEVSLIRNAGVQEVVQSTIARVTEAVQRPIEIAGHRFEGSVLTESKAIFRSVSVPTVYLTVQVVRRLFGYEPDRIPRIEMAYRLRSQGPSVFEVPQIRRSRAGP